MVPIAGGCGSLTLGEAQIEELENMDGPGHWVTLPNLCASREDPNPDVIMNQKIQAMIPGATVLSRCKDDSGSVRGCLKTERAYTAQCGQGFVHYACVVDSSCS